MTPGNQRFREQFDRAAGRARSATWPSAIASAGASSRCDVHAPLSREAVGSFCWRRRKYRQMVNTTSASSPPQKRTVSPLAQPRPRPSAGSCHGRDILRITAPVASLPRRMRQDGPQRVLHFGQNKNPLNRCWRSAFTCAIMAAGTSALPRRLCSRRGGGVDALPFPRAAYRTTGGTQISMDYSSPSPPGFMRPFRSPRASAAASRLQFNYVQPQRAASFSAATALFGGGKLA